MLQHGFRVTNYERRRERRDGLKSRIRCNIRRKSTQEYSTRTHVTAKGTEDDRREKRGEERCNQKWSQPLSAGMLVLGDVRTSCVFDIRKTKCTIHVTRVSNVHIKEVSRKDQFRPSRGRCSVIIASAQLNLSLPQR